MNKKKTFILLLLLTLPTLLPFFNHEFFYTQDHIFIARLQQMSTALSDGYFPVRWAPDLRFGEPLFNFYAPLPFYLGAAIKLLGFDFIWTAKILFILSSVLSALTMYIFCRKLFSTKAAFLAAALYTYAPYRAVDIYVRGALSETWAFIFFPLIFYTSLLLSEKVTLKNISFLSLSLAGLMLTHNVTTLMFLPFLGLWWLYLILKQKKWRLIVPLSCSFVLGIALSAFFLLPALFERQFIQTKYLIVGYFDFRAHFIALKQFFSTFWGYGSSLWGLDDGLSFQIGLVHWAVLILALGLGIILRKEKKLLLLLMFLGGSFLFSLFLQHNKSTFIWEAIPLMAFIQFPWRFLAISIFFVSIMGAVVTEPLRSRFRLGYFILIAAVILMNLQYFKPKEYVDDKFFDKFLNKESMHQGVDLTKDYLPVWVETTETEYFDKPKAEKGEIEVLDFKKRSHSISSSINVISHAEVELPVTYFPGWEVKANGKLITQSPPSKSGLVKFELPEGLYNVTVEFKDTPVRMVGNFLTLMTIALIVISLGFRRYKFK